ncbi:hypothetical protein, partial [Streptomyces africanus]|uniref:hypothetical protein n=1 Tax=Streptomyces africanus TaxID=231024 RepID=UPI001FCA0182
DADFLHAGELRAAEMAGAVSLRPAFSEAPEGEVRFVQHRIAAEAEEVWALLTAGASSPPAARAAARSAMAPRNGARPVPAAIMTTGADTPVASMRKASRHGCTRAYTVSPGWSVAR